MKKVKTNLQGVRLTTILRACTVVALLSILVFGLVYAPPSQRDTDRPPQSVGDLELFSSIVARLQAGTRTTLQWAQNFGLEATRQRP